MLSRVIVKTLSLLILIMSLEGCYIGYRGGDKLVKVEEAKKKAEKIARALDLYKKERGVYPWNGYFLVKEGYLKEEDFLIDLKRSDRVRYISFCKGKGEVVFGSDYYIEKEYTEEEMINLRQKESNEATTCGDSIYRLGFNVIEGDHIVLGDIYEGTYRDITSDYAYYPDEGYRKQNIEEWKNGKSRWRFKRMEGEWMVMD